MSWEDGVVTINIQLGTVKSWSVRIGVRDGVKSMAAYGITHDSP
jgi:hypothetical protein